MIPADPRPASPDDDRVAVLAAYLRANLGRYTDEALRQTVAQSGYTDAEFTAARALALDAGAVDRGPGGSRPNVGVATLIAIAYVVALYWLISTAAARSSDLAGTLALGGLVAGVVAWAVLRGRYPSVAQGIGCGVILAVAIPVVVVLVLLGICVVMGASSR